MTTGDVMYADILAEPLDDDLRLIWADWLMENGQQDRGEFVRVQVDLNRLLLAGEDEASLRVYDLRRRERELLTPWRVWEWIGLWPGKSGSPSALVKDGGQICLRGSMFEKDHWLTFRRGLVEEVV